MREKTVDRVMALLLVVLGAALILGIYIDYKTEPHWVVSGTAEPARIFNISSTKDGFVKSIHYRPGDSVRQGDVLLEIDPIEGQRRGTSSSGGVIAITAPIDGMVLSLSAKEGSRVGTEDLMEIGDISRFAVNLSFPWKVRQEFSKGMQVSLEARDEPHRRWEGVIERIDPRPVNNRGTRYQAHLELDNKDGWLIPGMPLKAKVWTKRPLETRG